MQRGLGRPLARLARPAVGAAWPLERAARRRQDLLPVLTYHRVLHPAELDGAGPSTTSATVSQLDRQLRFVARHRRALHLDELLDLRESGGTLPPGAVLLTFDDGYADFAAHAWPLLDQHQLPAVLFVPTALISAGGPGFWWDRTWLALLHTDRPTTGPTLAGDLPLGDRSRAVEAHRRLRAAFKRLPHDDLLEQVDALVARLGPAPAAPALLSWDQLRHMNGRGLTVAGHSATHPLLTKVSRRRLSTELSAPLEALRRELGTAPPALAYPGGAVDDAVATAASTAGYELGFGTRRGVADLRSVDWLRIDRINVSWRVPWPALRAQMAPAVADLVRSVA